ncbi:glycoside hydrolase family 43 protein [Maricaulis maris]|uniref:Alpha-N-arabinofuranosidase n=1 Tax=Maricaulis maris TaxID=74318 RepID=A0A495D3L2_9PROT|nr:glycoside hydrolase family 43 protein [Maricaulis maris]RKQ96501.1 alpha-N-arabinofuranosidase [Maricaulis maris]
MIRRLLLCTGLATLAACAAETAGSPTPGITPARFERFTYYGGDPVHEGVPQDAGTYLNPVLGGFYPDPSNTRAGEDYYLVTSTFSYFPGLPVFRSSDLVHWEQIGNAIDRPDQVDFGTLGLSRGLFAPAIEFHDGLFYILNTCVDCGGNFLITATDPAGPWSDPVWLPDLQWGIDPSLFVDEDGRAYLLNNGPPDREPEYEGHRAVWIQEFNLETLETFGERIVLIDGGVDFSEQPIWIEGPHIYKVDGRYYLMAAEGGTAENHSQVVLVGDAPMGPYTPYEDNPVLTQRDLPRDRANPITSAGHADLVQTPDGDWWATFLAVRPYGDDQYNTGRETFLMPVSWEDGWPRITGPGEAIPHAAARPDLPAGDPGIAPMTGAFTVVDEFDSEAMGPDWMMMRNPRETWWQLDGEALSLTPRPVGLGDFANPSYFGRRQQHMFGLAELAFSFTPDTPGARAGLAVLQNDEYWYFIGLEQTEDGLAIHLRRRAGSDDPSDGMVIAAAQVALNAGALIEVRATARGPHYDFDYRLPDGGWQNLLRGADGTILSTRTAGGFVGVTMGPHAYTPSHTD